MNKVVASLVLASIVSSSVSAVDVLGTMRSGFNSTTAYITKNPKTVGLSAAGLLTAGVVLAAYKYPEGRVRNTLNSMLPDRFKTKASPSDQKSEEEQPAETN
jgi:hypothetical protein